jgi:hypothetical protein
MIECLFMLTRLPDHTAYYDPGGELRASSGMEINQRSPRVVLAPLAMARATQSSEDPATGSRLCLLV